jgi:hypothetical protein
MVWNEARTAVLEYITLAALDRYFEMHEREPETVSQVKASILFDTASTYETSAKFDSKPHRAYA